MRNNKTTGWFEPHILNPANIDKVVGGEQAGVYVLANLGPDKKPLVQRINSGADVKQALQKNLGKYQIFMYKPFRFQSKPVGVRQEVAEYV